MVKDIFGILGAADASRARWTVGKGARGSLIADAEVELHAELRNFGGGGDSR